MYECILCTFISSLIRKRIWLNHSYMSNGCVFFFFSNFVVFKIHYLFIWRLKVFRLCANCNCSRMEYPLGIFFFEWTSHSLCHVRNALRFCSSLFIYHCRYNHHDNYLKQTLQRILFTLILRYRIALISEWNLSRKDEIQLVI